MNQLTAFSTGGNPYDSVDITLEDLLRRFGIKIDRPNVFTGSDGKKYQYEIKLQQDFFFPTKVTTNKKGIKSVAAASLLSQNLKFHQKVIWLKLLLKENHTNLI